VVPPTPPTAPNPTSGLTPALEAKAMDNWLPLPPVVDKDYQDFCAAAAAAAGYQPAVPLGGNNNDDDDDAVDAGVAAQLAALDAMSADDVSLLSAWLAAENISVKQEGGESGWVDTMPLAVVEEEEKEEIVVVPDNYEGGEKDSLFGGDDGKKDSLFGDDEAVMETGKDSDKDSWFGDVDVLFDL
jgi:hypothetical protein